MDSPPVAAPLPPVSERLRQLRPSQELLEYYRRKIEEFDAEQAEALAKLERYKTSFADEHKRDWELAQREEEIRELQKALSDMQMYLFQEREHVLRLYAENDRLKIQELEDRKKIQHLLGLTEPMNPATTYFRDKDSAPLVMASGRTKSAAAGSTRSSSKAAGRQRSSKRQLELSEEELSHKERNEALVLTVEALQAQLEDQARLAKEQISALMEDRSVREEEARKMHERDMEKVKALTDQLHHTQDLLYDSTRDFLELKFDLRMRERGDTEEKEHLLQRIEDLKDDLDATQAEMLAQAKQFRDERERFMQQALEEKRYRDQGTSAYRPGGRRYDVRSDTSSESGRLVARRDQLSELSSAPGRSDMQESLTDMYRDQCIQLEEELCRLREEKSASKEMFGDRTKKLVQRLALVQARYKKLEKRRKLEIEGYQTDIKMLRDRLKELEKQLYRVALRMNSSGPDEEMLGEVHKTAARSKKIMDGLQTLKSRIYAMEHDVMHCQDP